METTNQVAGGPTPTLDELLASVEEALKVPQPIGMLFDKVVYLNHWERSISFGTLTVSVDHAYLKGTRIQEAAMKALGEAPKTD